MTDLQTPPLTEPLQAGQRKAIAALALGAFAIGVAEFTVTGLLNDIAAGLHTSAPTMGNAIVLYALGVMVGGPLITVFGANLRRKTLLLMIVGLFVAGNAAALAASSFGFFAAARFVAGLPHGAYFGVAVAIGVAMVRPDRRGRVASHIVLGQTIANVLGVPAAAFLGQTFGWRSAFALVVGCGVLTLFAVIAFVPPGESGGAGRIAQSANALRNRRVWTAVAVGGIGFAGMYSVLSYIAPISTTVSGLSGALLPIVMMLFGIGMTVGALIGGRMADWNTGKSVAIAFALNAVVGLGFTALMSQRWAPFVAAFLIGIALQIAVQSLQLRLIDAAPTAPPVAAALNQSTANMANVLGTSLGSVVILSGMSYPGLGVLGAALASAGMLLALLALRGRA